MYAKQAFGLLAVSLYVTEIAGQFCKSLHADFTRRQLNEHNEATPYTQASGNKHTPFITIEDGVATVTVGDGNPYHPMVPIAEATQSPVHYVTHIWVKNQDDDYVHLQTMDPTAGAPATTSFTIPEGTTNLTAYEFCNLHGLWEGPTVDVETEGSGEASCVMDQPDPASWDSVHADFLRIQSSLFGVVSPFDESYGAKHVPYITISEDGTTGSVVVGTEEVYHPMSADAPHWVTAIYVTDENGNIIAMETLDPTDMDKAVMEFSIPESVDEVTAWEYCNLHGLWSGPAVKVNGDATETTEEEKDDATEATEEEMDTTTSPAAALVPASVLITILNILFYFQ